MQLQLRSLAVLPLLAAVLTLGACNSVTRVNTVEPEGMKAIPQPILLKKVNFDQSLASGAQVVSAYEGRTPAGAPRVQLNVANKSGGSETDFMWKAEWFDGSGMVIPGQNPQWTKVILLPGQDTTVTFMAPTTAAVDWRISMTRWKREG